MHLVFSSALLPDVQCDPVSLLLGADQVHVVGDEELASAGHRGAPWWHKEGGTKIRGPFVAFQLTREGKNKRKCYLINLMKGNSVGYIRTLIYFYFYFESATQEMPSPSPFNLFNLSWALIFEISAFLLHLSISSFLHFPQCPATTPCYYYASPPQPAPPCSFDRQSSFVPVTLPWLIISMAPALGDCSRLLTGCPILTFSGRASYSPARTDGRLLLDSFLAASAYRYTGIHREC